MRKRYVTFTDGFAYKRVGTKQFIMNIKKDIRSMVVVAYEEAIEGEGIYQDFDDASLDLESYEIDNFIDGISKEHLENWYDELAESIEQDFLKNTHDYSIDVHQEEITWKNPDVMDQMKQFYCNKIVSWYKELNKIVEIPLSIVDTELEHFITITCKLPNVQKGHYDQCLDDLMNRYPTVQSDEPIEAQLTAILEVQRKHSFNYVTDGMWYMK